MHSASNDFSRLLTPFQLGSRTLRNRVVMGAMHTGLEELQDGPQRMAAFYGARARGGVGLIVTGGFAPSGDGAATAGRGILNSLEGAAAHREITEVVHRAGSLILLQVLHAGGYARHGGAVAPSALPNKLCPVIPRELDEAGIEQTIVDHVRCAQLAQSAGYDGVEFLGAGGYLINAFFTPRTNQRIDRWGGNVANRGRFAIEIARRTRVALGTTSIIGFRLSLLDLVERGNTWDDTIWLARELKEVGVNYLNSTFGWHESRVPTIAGVVPTAAFSGLSGRLRKSVELPVVATNRINTPEQAEALLVRGDADLVALARPLLADPNFVTKAAAGKSDHINSCIACNQSCLDRTFSDRIVSCLVNPQACHETLWHVSTTDCPKRIAVVGAGLAGLACAVAAASRGHWVTLFEASDRIGGQFRLAAVVPGKEDYDRTLSYYERRLSETGVELRLRSTPAVGELSKFDHVVVATGVRPRIPQMKGLDHPKVVRYDDLLAGRCSAGERVVVIGAGGIAFDVAEYLTHDGVCDAASFMAAWGVDPTVSMCGGLSLARIDKRPWRQVHMLQRSPGKAGQGLGLTTGWIKRQLLERRGVQFTTGAICTAIDDDGVSIFIDGEKRWLPADTVVLCAGQESVDELTESLKAQGVLVSVVGGSRDSRGIDAERAIEEGMRMAVNLQ